jgi:hypothetical protein
MPRRIKNQPELPAWFSLDKYRDAQKLNAGGWYAQLYVRARCLSYLAEGEDLSPILNQIREMPIIDVTKYDDLGIHYHRGMFYRQPIIEQSLLGVHALTVHELYMAELNMGKDRRIRAREFFDGMLASLENPNPRGDPYRLDSTGTEFFYEPVHRISSLPQKQAMLGINLLLPDKELIEQFKAILPKLREECDAPVFPEKWRKPNFTEWIGLRVLPYLDLLLWETEQKTRMPYRVMEEALFPGAEGSEDRVRKTTAPKAQKLISAETLALLRAQAFLELGELHPG